MKILERIIVLLSALIIVVLLLPAPEKGKAKTSTYFDYKDDVKVVVSMGDSYSSGEGIEPFYGQDYKVKKKIENLDWLSHRSEKSWPGQIEIGGVSGKMADHRVDPYDFASKNGTDPKWYFVAVSGAETKHFSKEGQEKSYNKLDVLINRKGKTTLPKQMNVFKYVPSNETDYVTLTLGGNDLGFSDIVTKCVLTGKYIFPNTVSKAVNEKTKDQNLNPILDNIKRVYKDIAKNAGPQAVILVGGYPHLFEEDGSNTFINSKEAKCVNNGIDYFHDKLEKMIEECQNDGMNIYFIPVVEKFKGHEAYTKDPYINPVYLGSKAEDLSYLSAASSYSVHPNATGAKKYAECFNEKIKEIEKEKANKPTATPTPSKEESKKNLVSKEYEYDWNDELNSTSTYKYDERGNVIEKRTYFEFARTWYIYTYRYDKNDVMIYENLKYGESEEMIFNYADKTYSIIFDGEVAEFGTLDISRNELGDITNVTERPMNLDLDWTKQYICNYENGQLTFTELWNNQGGIDRTEYYYNSNKQLQTMISYDDGGYQLIYEYFYDESGKNTETIISAFEGELNKSYYGKIVYEY